MSKTILNLKVHRQVRRKGKGFLHRQVSNLHRPKEMLPGPSFVNMYGQTIIRKKSSDSLYNASESSTLVIFVIMFSTPEGDTVLCICESNPTSASRKENREERRQWVQEERYKILCYRPELRTPENWPPGTMCIPQSPKDFQSLPDGTKIRLTLPEYKEACEMKILGFVDIPKEYDQYGIPTKSTRYTITNGHDQKTCNCKLDADVLMEKNIIKLQCGCYGGCLCTNTL